ncbi:MAG TPA: nucleotidyltransferase [Actinomycetota bacterium]
MDDLTRFAEVLDRAVRALSKRDVPFGAIGGIGAAAWGRPRWDPSSADIDFLVRPRDVKDALAALEDDGFRSVETEEDHWLLKAELEDVGVDLIFRTAGDVYLDDEMIERLVVHVLEGVSVPVLSAEDLVVNKALAFSEQTPTYWAEALSILARVELDWDYLLRRARHGVHRVLSLLVYAQSRDLAVPAHAVRSLFALVDDEGHAPAEEETWNRPRALPTT